MNLVYSPKKALLLCAAVLLAVTITAAQEPKPAKPAPDAPQREKKVRDLDEALAELESAKKDLDKTVREIDWEKINADVKEAMQQVNVDLKKANAELKQALKEIDVEKMRADVEASVAKVDWDGLKRQLEQVKNINLEDVKVELQEVKVELEKLQPGLEKKLKEARVEIGKAKENLQAYKRFTDALEGDGLINKADGYTIEHKVGKLTINGKEQPAAVYEKHRAFLDKNKNFRLKKSDDDFEIHNED